jgi:lipid II isoglutaminyl synthase (glutamine-hydrolysing)
MTKHSLTIGWLYPDLMSTYGDRGNVICLQKRCEWRDIAVHILPIDQATTEKQIASIDLLFGGGSQDREQEIVMRDLMKKKKAIIQVVEAHKPALFVCGSPQIMGKFYEPGVGKRIEGLGIFDMESVHPGPDTPRCIGNIVARVQLHNLLPSEKQHTAMQPLIVGFENHGGRTYLGRNAKPFAHVIKGYGNNGKDHTEGVVYKNAIGCYFHGPLLPKNPFIADHLIATALKIKYKTTIALDPLDDTLETQARDAIVKRLGVEL